MMNQKRVLPDIYKTKRRKLNDAHESAENVDIKSTLATLKSLFPVEKIVNRLPPIIMKHQIYSLTQNRTEVDKHLNNLSSSGMIRIFKLGLEEDDMAIVYFLDYFQHIKKVSGGNSEVENFLCNVIQKSPDVSYDRKTLFEKYGVTENDIRSLVQCGILTVRDVGSWWLSIPGAGEFIKNYSKGRQQVLSMLRRAKYKEILYQELMSRKLGKNAKLGMQYHIHDIIGADLVTVLETSSGKVVRLRENE